LPPEPLQPLRVSRNRRFLTRGGVPFFWLGDTAWELFHRLTLDEADHYLRDRASRGFNVVQAVALAELDGLNAPNANGDRPLVDADPTRPHEPYWRHVDAIVARGNALALTVALLPTWGSHWQGDRAIFTLDNAEAYGAWIGARYANADVVWILGGDRAPKADDERSIIRAMAAGLRRTSSHLVSYHSHGANGSAEHFHDEPWLDFNLRQNGHAVDYTGRYDCTAFDYARTPTKPVIDGEPVYESIGIDFKPNEFGHAVAMDCRRACYWNLFDGALGHTYGHNAVWQMYDRGRSPVLEPCCTWRDALAAPGAGQMRHARALIESRSMLSRVPDVSLLVAEPGVPGAGRARFAATRDLAGSYAMAYAPVGRPFTVRLDAIRGPRVRAGWFDPRDGSAETIGTFDNAGPRTFEPPRPGECVDYVLVFDDAAANYPEPGHGRWPGNDIPEGDD
jgi:hypothetical protein